MRILLAANASYVPPRGGATRSNIVWLETLAERGHECRVIAALLPRDAESVKQLRDEQVDTELLEAGPGWEAVRRGKLTVFSAADPARRNELLARQVREFQPDWVLVSSEDVGQVLLGEASRLAPGRVVFLAHTPQFLPFGPESWSPNAPGTEAARRAAGVVVIGHHMAGYVERHLGRVAEVIHPPIYGAGPWRNLARFGEGLVTIVNPCAVKGAPIFLEVARRMPDVAFGALPGWGTTAADMRALEALPNVTILPNTKNIEDTLARTTVLFMPSLWYEGFGLIAMEALLRGIPVVASDSGGLVEAKKGTGFVIPVSPVERYEPVYDERGLPRMVAPEQDPEPWVEALRKLTSDREAYEAESQRSRIAAEKFVGSVDAGAMERWLSELTPGRRLKVLLAHNSLYYPAHGGGDRSNRLLMEALAERGHACRVVARLGSFGAEAHEQYLGELARRGVETESRESGVVTFRLNGVEAHVLTMNTALRAYFLGQVQEFAPDVIVASTDDPAQLMLAAALEQTTARVVYLARATIALPFGPDSAFPSAALTERLRRVDAAVGVSEYVARYMREHGAMANAVHVPISLMERGPAPPALGRFDSEFVTIVNPCAVKGIDIFLALADRMPEVRFAAVATWGTNSRDRARLEARSNVTILQPVDNIDDLLKRTRVLLVPSVWAEARSRIVVEAMQRGVPVLAANAGGIPEAKLGVPYLLPVRTIQRYRPEVDEQMVPVAEVPEQDITPWEEALRRVLTDRAHYEELARASREAAMRYAENLSVEPFERLLRQTVERPRVREAAASAATAGIPANALERLSPERRRLLALKLKKASAANVWFPALAMREGARVRLFAFPHAGAGAAAFSKWDERLPGAVSVCPVRLPGRESRMNEAPFRDMGALVEALGQAISPHAGRPFAFFGHSMGAGVAFELARWLRRKGLPLPVALVVSGARAPRFRAKPLEAPEPSDAEFIEEIRRRDGMPAEVLNDPELMRLILPALKADTILYRNWVCAKEEPLACPIRAYGGAADANVRREHLEAWAEETSAGFVLRVFKGGHFYLKENAGAFFEALGRDLEEVIG
ncbi:MAG: alpha/beta fold hydrolase [bacterium]